MFQHFVIGVIYISGAFQHFHGVFNFYLCLEKLSKPSREVGIFLGIGLTRLHLPTVVHYVTRSVF